MYFEVMIFNLFKSKPTLKEIIPNGFVDIHSHILPGIDDGAKDIKESIELIKGMKKLGFSKIIGTPHTYPGLYNNSSDSIKESFMEIESYNVENIEIDYASEYFVDNYLIEKAEKKTLLSLKDNYVLLESGFLGELENFEDIVFKIKINGFTPIIAHPERYSFYYNNKRKYFKLKNMGCKFQLNLLSATGYYGKECTQITDYMLKNKLIDFVGSDIHKHYHIKQFEKKIKINKINELESCISNNALFNN